MITEEKIFREIILMLNNESAARGNAGRFFLESNTSKSEDGIDYNILWGWRHPFYSTASNMIRYNFSIPKFQLENSALDIKTIQEGKFWNSILMSFIRYSLLGKRMERQVVGDNRKISPYISIRDLIENEEESVRLINEHI
jgi:hypothetical protein